MGINQYDEQLEQLDDTRTANPYEALLDEEEQASQLALRRATASSDLSPDDAAEARRLGLRYNIPPSVVGRNLATWKQRAQNDQPWGEITRQSPRLTQALEEQPDLTAIVKDDLEQLGALEWLTQAPARAFARGTSMVEFGKLRTESLFRELTQAERDKLSVLRLAMEDGGALGAGDSWFRKAIVGGAENLPNQFAAGLQALKYGAAGAAMMGATGAAGGSLVPGVGTVAGGLSGAGLGLRAGGLYGAGKFGFELEAGLAYDEYLEATDEAGRRIDTNAAKAAAIAAGAINAGLEAGGIALLAKTIPGLDQLGAVGVRAAVKRALRVPTVRAALGQAIATYGGTLTAETLTEVAQRSVTILAGELGKVASTNPPAPRRPSDVAEDLATEALGAVSAFGLTVLPGPMLYVAQQHAAAKRAENNTAFFNALAGQVQASQTMQRAPEAMQGLLERFLKGGPVETVYAPVDAWVTYWQSKGVDPDRMAAEITGRPEALEQARATGEDLAIPTAVYATKLAPTEHNRFWTEELRLAPGEMNARESAAFQEQLEALTAEAGARAAEQDGTASQVRDQVTQQLERAGVPTDTAASYARLYEAAFGVLAERAGLDPLEVYSRYGLKIERPDVSRKDTGVSRKDSTPAEPEAALGTEVAPASESPTGPPALEDTATSAAAADLETPTTPGLETSEAAPGAEGVPGLEALEAELTGVSDVQVVEDAAGPNASGDSAASREALSRQEGMAARGERYVVYDRAGRRRELIGPEAVDYETREGETYGIEGPEGFRRLDDRGGRIVDTNAPAAQTEDANVERPAAEPGEAAGTERSAPSDRVPASSQTNPRESPKQRAERREQHYADVFRVIYARAKAVDPTVKRKALRQEFDSRVALLEELERDYQESGADPRALLDFIASKGGLSLRAERGGYEGELRRIRESPAMRAFGGFAGVAKVWQSRTLNANGQTKTGHSLDGMVGLMADDPRFHYIETIDDLIAALDNISLMGDVGMRAAVNFPGTRELERQAGMRRDVAWWKANAPIDEEVVDFTDPDAVDALGDAFEVEGGDTSFNIDEFSQSLFDDLEPIGPVDTLATGEQQPRLPGAEDVREQEQATPEFDLPFALTPPENKSRKGKQTTLFQSAPADPEAFARWFGESKVVDAAGRPLAVYHGTLEGGFDRFNASESGVNYFTDSLDTAESYAGSRRLARVGVEAPSVYKVYLKIENPLVVDFDGNHYDGYRAGATDQSDPESWTDVTLADAIAEAKAQGHDGLIAKNIIAQGPEGDMEVGGDPATVFVVFESTQVKSVYNQGTFDPNDERILYQSAWHGSPHIFEQFSLHAIGTGEGAQSYGWGLYFASRREVAEHYRDALANRGLSPEHHRARGVIKQAGSIVAARALLRGQIDAYERAIGLSTAVDVAVDAEPFDRAKYEAAAAERDAAIVAAGESSRGGLTKAQLRAGQAFARDVLELLESEDFAERKGRTYKVEIPEDDSYLDWDKPASQQSPKVQEALRALGVEWAPFKTKSLAQMRRWLDGPAAAALWREDIGIRETIESARYLADIGAEADLKSWQYQHQGYFRQGAVDPQGRRIYEELALRARTRDRAIETQPSGRQVYENVSLKQAAERASKALAEHGVVGIRYLDGLSRRAGEGSSNYVVFDDRLVQITEFFQSAPGALDEDGLQAWAQGVKDRIGPDLVVFDVRLDQRGDINLDSLAMRRGATRAGLGTKVMLELTRFADAHNRRIVLQLADKGYHPDDAAATTSGKAALERFYRRLGFVRNAGRHKNFRLSIYTSMYREPVYQPQAITAPKQSDVAGLVVQHNLTERNLQRAVERGGLAVPSLAITKAEDALTNFGEVTLIGAPAMADPSADTQVYAADVYSPRYPTIHYKIDRAGEDALAKRLAPMDAVLGGRGYYDLDQLQQDGARSLRYDRRVLALFLTERGLTIDVASGETDDYYNRQETDRRMRALLTEHGLDEAFDRFTEELFASLKPTEQIYKGFTNMGRRSYAPHTLENVVRILKRDIRGGESQTNLYGPGQLRAKFAERFRNRRAIQRAAGRIVDDATFDQKREALNAEVFAIADSLRPYYEHDANTFRFVDTVMAVIEESPKGLERALKDYGFVDVNDDAKRQIRAFVAKLKTYPTEYFEGKITRAVGIGEFAAAVIPADASQATRDALAKAGITRIVEYVRAGTNDGGAAARKAAIAKLALEDSDDLLFQQQATNRRGAIRFGADRQFTISLLERADLSTFLHESGHFFLEVASDLVDELRQRGPEALDDRQRALVADHEQLLAWLGVASRAEIGIEHHEKFARAFEAYLMEGQAPNLALRSVFARFRAWLVGIYKQLRSLNVDLTPEVRGVFDRMLATDAAILAAEQERGVSQMFLTAADAGMTDQEFALYRHAVSQASQTAREQLERRLLGEVQREQEAQWRERQDQVRAEVEESVYNRPAYRALAAMQRGTHPDGTPLEGAAGVPLRLSRAILIERYGAERLKRLPRPYVYSADGGLDPDVVADMFGFDSGDALLSALEDLPPLRAVIEQETRARMMAEFGSILLDGTLHDKATTAIANEDRDLIVRAELRALGRLRQTVRPFVQAEQAKLQAERRERSYERRWMDAEAKLRVAVAEARKQEEIDELRAEVRNLRQKARGGAAVINAAIPPAAVVRDAAKARIAAMRIRDIKPDVFWHASRRASQQALERAARQDFDGAIEAKQRELLNLNLYRQAQQALEDVEARVKWARGLVKPTQQAMLGKAGESYVDQVNGLLDRYEFARVSQRSLDRRASLRKWKEGLESQGLPVDIPEELLEESQRQNYAELTVEGLVGVTDGLKAIVHLARLKDRLLRNQQQRELTATATAIADSIREHAKGKRATPVDRDRTLATERRRMVAGFFAAHRKLASLVRELDGFQDGGPLWEAIVRPLNEAGAREAEMTAAATQRFSGLVERAYPGRRKRDLYVKAHIPAIGQSLSKMARIMVALNWGNEGNRDRIRRAEKWSDEQVQAILNTLDAGDLAFVQGVFDAINAYWPDIAEKQERVYGIAPAKVEATPIRTPFGEIAGGYFPLRYDERLSAKAGAQLDLEAANLAKQAAYAHATTKRGHTKERVQGVRLPVRMDFGVIFEHVGQVIHDLSHHEALIDVGRILAHPLVQQAIYEVRGDQVYREIKTSVRDVAFGDVPAVNAFERAINHLRTGATVAGLGWNLTTALLQPIGLTQSMVRIGPAWVARGLGRWIRNAATFEATGAWINERSAFMRSRARTQQREINEIRNQLGVSTGRFKGWLEDALRTSTLGKVGQQDVADSYFWMIQAMQKVADIPTWLGAYEKAMAAGETEDRAVALADQAVLDSQGGGQTKDLAAVQRGGPMFKLWTNFYSFFSTTWNLTVESTKRTNFASPLSVGRLAVDYVLLYSAPATLGFLLRNALRGDTDDDGFLEALVRENAAYLMGTLMGVRELSGAVQGYAGYEGPAGARAIANAARLVKQVEQGEADAAFWRALNQTAGALFHYPASQVQRTLEGLAAVAEGRTEHAGAIVAGPPKGAQ